MPEALWIILAIVATIITVGVFSRAWSKENKPPEEPK